MAIRCRLCNERFHNISVSHLKFRHGYTMQQYRAEFPDAPLFSRKARRNLQERNRRMWSDPNHRHNLSQVTKESWKDPNVRKLRLKRHKKAVREKSYRKKLSDSQKQAWSDEDRRQRGSRVMKEVWKNPAHRKRAVAAMKKAANRPEERKRRSLALAHMWRKWWKPELKLKDLLVAMGLYGPHAFEDHIQIKGSKFSFNADFASREKRLIIHVDGVRYHHDPTHPRYEWRRARDLHIDEWCATNGWEFIRLTDKQINNDLGSCQKKIVELVG